ncbi:MAG: TldD/PmbA family protein [Bryobacteraceae bacterium]|nr:TldD/PmbA family protein [Bryobacteraceae bacterium]
MKEALEEMAQAVVRKALRGGASDAECTVLDRTEFSTTVRMREVENLKEAGSRAAGVRVLKGKRSGSAYTSDLTAEGLDRMVDAALQLAEVTGEDPFAGLPETEELGSLKGALNLYHPDVEEMQAEEKIRRAREAEEAAFAYDPRIGNSEGATFSSTLGRRAFANSRGFAGSYRTSSCSLSALPVAREGESMERDYWFTAARSAAELEPAELVGRIAAQRALRRLHRRKVRTQTVPVVFEPWAARSLVGHLFDAVSGDAVYRKASFLAGKLGEKVASDSFTVVDDATIPGLFGTSPFDDEGTPSRRTVVVENGVLKNYLLNTYTARKLGLRTTGCASRGVTGNTSVGHGNFYLEKGAAKPADIIKSVPSGLYVTELMGFGVNNVTGDYSRGAAGLWIENGELAYPVSEITIAGNLLRMFQDIEQVGDDLEFRGSAASPTILIREMTVSGQ